LKRFFNKINPYIWALIVDMLCSLTLITLVWTLYKLNLLIEACSSMWTHFDQVEKINIILAKRLLLNFEILLFSGLYYSILLISCFLKDYYWGKEATYLDINMDYFLMVMEVYLYIFIAGDMSCRIIIFIIESSLY
jgi:hypothetical protein